MSQWLTRLLWRALGRRYTRVVLYAYFQVAHLITLAGVALLALYADLDGGQFGRIVAVSQALVFLENLASIWFVGRLLRPADPWLRGQRDPATAAQAWRALVALPIDYLTFRPGVPVFFSVVPIAVYIWLEVGGGWLALPVLMAGATIVLAYGVFVRFFAMEVILRPVLEQVAGEMGDAAASARARSLPLRARFLLALPVINVVTGVAVAGLSDPGGGDLGDLGVDVLVAVGVAFTLSLWLSVSLARSVTVPMRDLRRATDRVAQGDLTARVPVISTDEVGRLAASFNGAVRGLGERERLREAFGAFVDPVLADRVLEEGTTLAGEEVDVTIMFLDIRSFTAFAERAGPRQVVETLNGLFAAVVPVLARHGGHANKFLGDGVLGVFGAPERHDDHADRALAAALEIAVLVRERHGEGLRVGIGLNSGSVVAGTVGGGGRLEFAVIGDAVNTAARVERATRDTGDDLLVTEATRARLRRDHGTFEPRPDVALRGKARPQRLWTPTAQTMEAVRDRLAAAGDVARAESPPRGADREPTTGAARAAAWVRARRPRVRG